MMGSRLIGQWNSSVDIDMDFDCKEEGEEKSSCDFTFSMSSIESLDSFVMPYATRSITSEGVRLIARFIESYVTFLFLALLPITAAEMSDFFEDDDGVITR